MAPNSAISSTVPAPPAASDCYKIEFALDQLEACHPDLTWYTTGQFKDARGFYDRRYRQSSASPWTAE